MTQPEHARSRRVSLLYRCSPTAPDAVLEMRIGAVALREAVVRNVFRLVNGLFFDRVGANLAWASRPYRRLGDRLAANVVRRRHASKAATRVA